MTPPTISLSSIAECIISRQFVLYDCLQPAANKINGLHS